MSKLSERALEEVKSIMCEHIGDQRYFYDEEDEDQADGLMSKINNCKTLNQVAVIVSGMAWDVESFESILEASGVDITDEEIVSEYTQSIFWST